MFLLILVVIVALFVRFGISTRTKAMLRVALRPALVLGGIGFITGFFGPMIFTPGANQGPMLGIFITGPAGFALGLIYGIFRALGNTSSAKT
jgi:hypothetical protein